MINLELFNKKRHPSNLIDVDEDNNKYNLFLTTNEKDSLITLETIAHLPVENKVMFTVSGLFGLDVASVAGSESDQPERKIEYLIVLDKGMAAKKFWTQLQVILAMTPHKEEATQQISNLIAKKWHHFFNIPAKAALALRKLKNEIEKGHSFLSTKKRYAVIHGLFSRNHFAFIGADLCESNICSKIAKTMKKLNLKFHIIYTSNIREYVEEADPKGFKSFREALKKLKKVTQKNSLHIDTVPRVQGLQSSDSPIQRVSLFN
jgi:hypothetical protein